MKLLQDFKEWLANSPEKKAFMEMWDKVNPRLVREWADFSTDYHKSVAWTIYEAQKGLEASNEVIDNLQTRIEALENKLTKMAPANASS